MQIGDTIYYREGEGRFVHKDTYQGETSRSWLFGVSWKPSKHAKKITKFVTEEEYNLSLWASKNNWRIAERVRYYATPEQLKLIAAMVGYEEPSA